MNQHTFRQNETSRHAQLCVSCGQGANHSNHATAQSVTVLPGWGMTCGNFFRRPNKPTAAVIVEGKPRVGGNVLVKLDAEVDGTQRTWEVPQRGLAEYASLFGEVSA